MTGLIQCNIVITDWRSSKYFLSAPEDKALTFYAKLLARIASLALHAKQRDWTETK